MPSPTIPGRGAGRRPGARQKRRAAPLLSRSAIVAAALSVVDRNGLKALSMRRLGAELGVDPMAVYYYIPNKQALLDAIVEAVMAEIDLSVDNPADPPETRILRAACGYRDVLMAHANALPILLAHGPVTKAALRPVEVLVRILREAGLPPAESFSGMNAIAAAVRGAVGMLQKEKSGAKPGADQYEATIRLLPPAEFPHLLEAAPYAQEFLSSGFEFGIRALARGLLPEDRGNGATEP